MIRISKELTPKKLKHCIERLFELSGEKIRAIDKTFGASGRSPVLTFDGVYKPCEWSDWTRGFMYGSALLQYDATAEEWFLEYGKRCTSEWMTVYLTHMGVHDHGFNNVSTYGNLLRLASEGKLQASAPERQLYAMALKVSGAVQAARWSTIRDGRGYIYSFCGPHSLFADSFRSLRSLALAHRLGHELRLDNERRVSLLERLWNHAALILEFNVYYGEERDAYDVRGRVAHESIFDVREGTYRCPSTQQGYSPFSTWTRGLAWVALGCAEQLEYLETVSDQELESLGGRDKVESTFRRAAQATCDYFLDQTAQDGIPFWDTGAPQLVKLGDWGDQPSDPFNDFEPVDSSAAAITAQGLWRLGTYLLRRPESVEMARRYRQAALTIADTLFREPYLSTQSQHQGLILHSIYHRPLGWDHVPHGHQIPCGESSMWGDYHARELGLLLLREAKREPSFAFFNVGA